VPPALDLDAERALQQLLVDAAAAGLLRSAQDCAEGGVAVAVAESCFDAGVGAEIALDAVELPDAPAFADVATLFGESASRVVVSVARAAVDDLLGRARAAGLPAVEVGRTGGDRIRISVGGRLKVDQALADAERQWSTAIARYFERSTARP
jgi:phosphoribosylformylglycinamidine synthase subunit PurL